MVSLANASDGAQITTGSAIGAIRNDDETLSTELSLSASDADKAENNGDSGTFNFTVARSGVTSGATTVDYAVSGAGAAPADDADFAGGALPSGQLAFAPGETSKTLAVNVQGDGNVEPDEGFLVTLANASGGAQIIASSASGAIRNDDVTELSLTVLDPDKPEGNGGATPFAFLVTRSGDTSGETTVDYTVTDVETPADDADFFAGIRPGGQLTFAPGESEQTLIIYVQGDTDPEENEDFLVTLTNASAGTQIIGSASAVADIRNDDTAALMQLSLPATTLEQLEGDDGASAFHFTVTRDGNTSGVFAVDYFVTGTGASPTNGADFVGGTMPSGQVTFADGDNSTLLVINVQGDISEEPDESFMVILENYSGGAQLVDGGSIGIIRNDDGWSPQETTAIAKTVVDAQKVAPIAPARDTVNTTTAPPTGDDYKYTIEKHDVVDNIDNIVYLGLNDDLVWPGNLVDGSKAPDFVYTPISLPRTPISISVSLETACTGPFITQNVNDPKLSTMRQGISDLLKKAVVGCTKVPAQAEFKIEQIYSQSQMNLFADADVKYGAGSLDTKFNWDSTTRKNKIVAMYRQVNCYDSSGSDESAWSNKTLVGDTFFGTHAIELSSADFGATFNLTIVPIQSPSTAPPTTP